MFPLEVTFRHLPESDALKDSIFRRASRWGVLGRKIVNCHVVVDAPHGRNSHADPFHVSVSVKVPGDAIVVNKKPQVPENVYSAVNEVMDTADRRLRTYFRRKGWS